MKKEIYSQPTAEIFELRLSANVLQGTSPNGPGSGYNKNGNAGNTMTEDDGYSYSF